MKLKVILATLLFAFVSFFNPANADVWFPMSSANGNTQEVELDTIEIDNNFVTFNSKSHDKNYDYIAKMRINLEDKTFAMINMRALQGNKMVKFNDNSKNIQYKPIKEGSLADSVYTMMISAKESPALDVKMKSWERYFKKQQRIVQKSWHPNFNRSYVFEPSDNATAYMILILDKNGNILSKTYQNNTNTDAKYDKFNKVLKQKIEDIFVKVPKFEPLPKDFRGDKIMLVMKFVYTYQNNANSTPIKWEETGIAYMDNEKNHCSWVSFGKFMFAITTFPVALVCKMFGKDIYAWF